MDRRAAEAAAIARVAAAARDVQSASGALEQHFRDAEGGPAPTLMLARLAAAMSELQSAREAFDVLLAAKGPSGGA
ncbi:hypothetical protein NK8_04500 [Caballeronia sp. NK8]|nr:hypothetical protein NK8_04500 [Caballeronia sp. NK8]